MTMVTIRREGRQSAYTLDSWWDEWDRASAEHKDRMRDWASEAEVTVDGGRRLAGGPLIAMRHRLVETYDRLGNSWPGRRRLVQAERRFLIPDLWPWGTVPAMGGNHKAGKSTVVTDLVRALMVPGYRFLDHFAEVEMTQEERWRGVVVVNTESPPEDFEAAIDSHGMTEEAWRALTVEHLEDLGGAHLMDLTNPHFYDLWVQRLLYCNDCDGSDFYPPTVVIVDTVTAIALALGENPETYFGKWFAAFRRLLNTCDIPNGLAVGHNTMGGGHLLGGSAASAGPDGLWTFSSDRVDNPASARRFSLSPRLGSLRPILPMPVVLTEEGRPVAQPPTKAEKEVAEAEPFEDVVMTVAKRTAVYVREHPGAHGEELSQNVDDGGWKENNLKGRSKALELGLIRKEPCRPGCAHCKRPHHKRSHYYPV